MTLPVKAEQADCSAALTPAQRRVAHQRGRILQAAQQCFIKQGFYAASIASIASAADMSPGLIYRYFANKAAIIVAIIEQSLERQVFDISGLASESCLIPTWVGMLRQWQAGTPDTPDPVLYLDMTAEAYRDPQVRDTLQYADTVRDAELSDWLSRMAQARGVCLPAAVAQERAIVLRCLIEGLLMRVVREPEIDLDTLTDGLDRVVVTLVSTSAAATPHHDLRISRRTRQPK